MGGIFLLLGSNMGDRLGNLSDAAMHIKGFAKITRTSSVYVTAAWGNTNQPDFFNQVIEVETSLSEQGLLQKVLDTEVTMGRNRVEKWGPRVIDIDILFFHDSVINEPNLKIPHPEIQNRKFTLIPLRELAPHFVHPVFRKTIAQIDDECTDTLTVKRLPPQHSEQSS